jgi:hypothetical protein
VPEGDSKKVNYNTRGHIESNEKEVNKAETSPPLYTPVLTLLTPSGSNSTYCLIITHTLSKHPNEIVISITNIQL